MESGPGLVEMDASEEKKGPQFFAEFDYLGHHFKILRSDSPVSHLTHFTVQDDTGKEQARIKGDLVVRRTSGKMFFAKETVFYAVDSANLEIDLGNQGASKQPGHYPRLVTETITQIVSQGKVNEWNSSTSLSPGGEGMYKYMQSHFPGKVKVTHNGLSYKVTKQKRILGLLRRR